MLDAKKKSGPVLGGGFLLDIDRATLTALDTPRHATKIVSIYLCHLLQSKVDL